MIIKNDYVIDDVDTCLILKSQGCYDVYEIDSNFILPGQFVINHAIDKF